MRIGTRIGWATVLTVVTFVVFAEPTLAAIAADSSDADFLDEAGRIVGSPSAGPSPEHPGDRGGYAQFLTLAVMVAGLGFIAWRINRQVRRHQTR